MTFADQLAAEKPTKRAGQSFVDRVDEGTRAALFEVRQKYADGNLTHLTNRRIWQACRDEFGLDIGETQFVRWLKGT